MEIDWVTFIAQIVNFLILVWLLKRFLYAPVVKAMNEREQKIADRLRDAEQREKDAQEKESVYQQKLKEIDEQQTRMLQQAKKDIEGQKQQMKEQARNDVDHQKTEWESALQQKKESLLLDIRRQSVDFAGGIARRALADLADEQLETRMVEAFVRQVKKLDSDEQGKIARLVRGSKKPIRMISAFDLKKEQQDSIVQTLRDTVDSSINVSFETAPHLVAGIELRTDGYKLSWNIENYLNEFMETLERTIDARSAGAG